MSTLHQPRPTGRREERHGETFLVFERTFRAPIEDVWAAVTDSHRLARWIGEWTGDPASGSVTFRMTAEGDEAGDETIWVDACDPPRRLVMRSAQPDDLEKLWAWEVDLAEADGTTTLTFAQGVTDSTLAEGVGPGWDYYLDRLVVAEAGGDVSAVDFDDYHPAFSDHYRSELA
ncbi:MAG TPA: SRPBCC family protein [Nocardioides sp.]|nr:SRPBCC family protein [Nocardioides sp.]